MRILRALRTFNTVAFAILSVIAICMLLTSAVMIIRDRQQTEDYSSQLDGQTSDANAIQGQLIEAGDRKLNLYARGALNGEFRTDLRFVDARDGSTTRLSNDPTQKFYSGNVVGVPRTENMDHGYGYLTRAKVGELDGQPLFDAIFVRFSDMKQFKIATRITALDGPRELDGKSFSAVVWDTQDKGRFLLFDSEVGKVAVTKDLDMQGQKLSDSDLDAPAAAPYNKFH